MLSEDELWEQLLHKGSANYTLNRGRSCIGKRILIYELPIAIQTDFFVMFGPSGELIFPLGEKYPYYQFTLPGLLVMTGLLGDFEIKVVPRIKASLPEVAQRVAEALDQFCHTYS